MRNVLVIDYDNNLLGYSNEGCCDRNYIELQFKTNIDYNTIELTKQDGTITILTSNELPFDIYKTQGELKIRLTSTTTATGYVVLCIPNDLQTTDNVIVKTNNNQYVIRKVTDTGGGPDTSDHAQLKHLDYSSSGHTGFASDNEATTTYKGLMSAADKTKLDDIGTITDNDIQTIINKVDSIL